jgi:recombinational DNA repair protein RecR
MGKHTKTEQKLDKDPQEHPISKKRTLIANLNAYIRMLKHNFPQLSAKQYLKNIHIFLGKIKRKLKSDDQQKLVEARQKIKICVKCEGWSSNKSFIKCNYC